MAEDTGQGTNCLVLSQNSLGRKSFSSYAFTQLWQVPTTAGPWLEPLQVGPGSVVPHETGTGTFHYSTPISKDPKEGATGLWGIVLVRVLLL